MRIREYGIKYERGNAPSGLRLALASDLHSKEYDNAVQTIREHKPDIICCAGDILERSDTYSLHESFNQNGARFLSECADIAPTVYSTGNHERGFTDENRSAIADMGVTILDNEIKKLCGVAVAGISSGYISGMEKQRSTPPPNTAFTERVRTIRSFRLILCHHPEYWRDYLSDISPSLILSGHAHGGQWRIPFGGGIFAPGQGIFPKYTGGVHRKGDSVLVISRGMANNTFVPRLFNPRELVFIEIL